MMQRTHAQTIVCIEKLHGLHRRPRLAGKIGAGIPSRAGAAVIQAQISNALRVSARVGAADLVGLGKWTTVIDEHDAIIDVRPLPQHRFNGVGQQQRLPVNRNHDCDAWIRHCFPLPPWPSLTCRLVKGPILWA